MTTTRSRRAAEVAAASALLVAGVIVAALSRRLPYWHDFAPGPGFLPTWLGVLLTVAAAFELVVLSKERAASTVSIGDRDPSASDAPMSRRAAMLAVLSVGAAFLVSPLGFVLAIAVFAAAAAWTLAPERRVANAMTAIAIPCGVWLVFVAWLGVPLPRGPFGF